MNLKTTLLNIGVVIAAFTTWAGTTIDPANRYSFGANVGWSNWAGDATNGVVIGDYVCSGYVYFANFGWLSLGNGHPTNLIRYQNVSAQDFGVNHDGVGNLRGLGYGANIGWVSFENLGAPKVDLVTGVLSGYVWSANCGWISLSNALSHVQTLTLSPGILDTNGLPVAWEMTYFNHIGISPSDDTDHDSMSNLREYLAGTDPTDPGDNLVITDSSFSSLGTNVTITWKSVPTRLYRLVGTWNITSPEWSDIGLGLIFPDGYSTTRSFDTTNAAAMFFKVRVARPLSD